MRSHETLWCISGAYLARAWCISYPRFSHPPPPKHNDAAPVPQEKSSDHEGDEAAAKATEKDAQAAAAEEREVARGMTDIRDLRATLSSICGDLSVSTLVAHTRRRRLERSLRSWGCL